jgi:hypothetical protein
MARLHDLRCGAGAKIHRSSERRMRGQRFSGPCAGQQHKKYSRRPAEFRDVAPGAQADEVDLATSDTSQRASQHELESKLIRRGEPLGNRDPPQVVGIGPNRIHPAVT